jgi:hypothetical protein
MVRSSVNTTIEGEGIQQRREQGDSANIYG